jgi:excisionase family DNA binding protein
VHIATEENRVEQLLNVQDVAAKTRTTVSYWRKLISQRRIPVVKIGRLIRLRAEDVERVLRDGYRPAR